MPGNHEYFTPGAAGYFDYFAQRGVNVGTRSQGFYAHSIGDWHFLALNTNCSAIGGCDENSPQYRWLQAELAANRRRCTVAHMHHAYLSSGRNGGTPELRPFMKLLYNNNVEIVLVGHDHTYERFSPITPENLPDQGLRGDRPRRPVRGRQDRFHPEVVPRGIVHRFALGQGPHRYLVFESSDYVRAPRRYRGDHGQLLEGAPHSERDFRVPQSLRARDEKGSFGIPVKAHDLLTRITLEHHPFDVVGWDGYYYPYAFSIHAFEPKVGRTHLPPPVHQTFEADGFVICSFCPRPYDFDKDAIPAPYAHTNAMSDEVIFYASAEFMSRKGVSFGSITLHPDGLPPTGGPSRAGPRPRSAPRGPTNWRSCWTPSSLSAWPKACSRPRTPRTGGPGSS